MCYCEAKLVWCKNQKIPILNKNKLSTDLINYYYKNKCRHFCNVYVNL